MFQCEEVLAHDKYDWMSNETASEHGSYFTYSSHLCTKGELEIYDEYDSLNKEEYEHFMFPLDSMHELHDDEYFQFGPDIF